MKFETISEMAKSYSEVAATTVETDEELKNDNKQSFKEEFLNNIEDFSDKFNRKIETRCPFGFFEKEC